MFNKVLDYVFSIIADVTAVLTLVVLFDIIFDFVKYGVGEGLAYLWIGCCTVLAIKHFVNKVMVSIEVMKVEVQEEAA